ncbi:MAG: lipocalin family protein [Phycisphaerales bacterium]
MYRLPLASLLPLHRLAGLALGCTLLMTACASAPRTAAVTKPGPLPTVANVDLGKYTGQWYEVARYDNRWQRGTVNVIADYSLYPNGTIKLANSARKDSLTGKVKKGTGKGSVKKGSNNAKWRVQFVWPFKADYWIIDLCPDYQWAVVGQPSRDNLWILSRTPVLDADIVTGIHTRLQTNGYDIKKLVTTTQPVDAPTFAPGGGIVQPPKPEGG